MDIIEVENLKKYFGPTKAVGGISFRVGQGEIVGFLGPNGAGKSTTINCLMDFIRPDQGRIKIFGLDHREQSPRIKKRVGYLSEENNLYPHWTGQEHIELVKRIRGAGKIFKKIISRLDFDIKKPVRDLSSGNKQKLGIILAMIHQPELLILDEPTKGLDPLLQQTIYSLLKKQVKRSATIFLSSHNLAEVEQICDRVVIIKKGRIIAIESIDQLRKKQLYKVVVRFKNKVSQKQFADKITKIEEKIESGLILQHHGPIEPLLKKLLQFQITDLEIKHASLEDIFLKYYQ